MEIDPETRRGLEALRTYFEASRHMTDAALKFIDGQLAGREPIVAIGLPTPEEAVVSIEEYLRRKA